MDLDKIYELASQGATPSKPYPSELPEQLAPWHVYFADASHSILCVVGERWAKLLERSAVVAELLASVSVKTLLRVGWDVHPRFGVIVARNVEYDSMYGVVTSHGDEEF